MAREDRKFVWKQVVWRRPFELEDVENVLRHLAGQSPRGMITWEIRAREHQVYYLIGMEQKFIHRVQGIFQAHAEVDFVDSNVMRTDVKTVARVKISHPTLPLNTDVSLSTIRAILAALVTTKPKEEVVIQLILGASHAPETVAKDLPDPTTDWLSVILGKTSKASPAMRKTVEGKKMQQRFECVMRIGTTAANPYHINMILASLKTLESAGVRIWTKAESCVALNAVHIPWQMNLILPIGELATLMALPAGEADYAGTHHLHPRLTIPPYWYSAPLEAEARRCFAVSQSYPPKKLCITPKDSLEHTIILGPTGAGKSTLMLNLIMADINAGRSVLVIDPKADLVSDILARVLRAEIVARIADDIVLKDFWERFETMSASERRTQTETVLNKMRQFLFRPALRNVLGQSAPKFNFPDLFYTRKIVLVPLNKGLIGNESARLLGSLIVGMTWTLALSRAQIPKERRHIVSVFIDELQDYVSLPAELRAGVDANARNKIVFGLNAADAKEMATQAGDLAVADFMGLPRYEVYASIMNHGRRTNWILGRTEAPSEPLRLAAELKAESMARYGVPAGETERAYANLLRKCRENDGLSGADNARVKRTG